MSDFHSELPNLIDRSVKALFRECPTAVMRLAGIEVADKAVRVEDPNLNLSELRADHIFVIEEEFKKTLPLLPSIWSINSNRMRTC